MHATPHPSRFSLTASVFSLLLCGVSLAQDGTLLWKFPVGGSMFFCPAIDEEGVVYISAPDKNVHALNGETGEVLWSYPTERGLSTAPVLGPDGTVFVGLAETNIVALNGATGELLWETPSGGEVLVLGLSDDSRLFAHGGGGLAMALNAADGEVIWEVNLGTIIPSWGMALDAAGTVFLFTGGKLLSVDGTSGDVVAEHVTDGGPTSSCNPVLGADGTAYCGSRYLGLHALDAYSGAVRWNAGLLLHPESPLVLGLDGTVYVNNGALHAINAATGRDLWILDPEGSIWGSPSLAADGTLYVGADDGNFYALDASNGTEKWRFTRADSRFRTSTIGPNGTVYVVSSDGNFYALRGSAPLADSPWPKWQQNLANTGQSDWLEGAAGVLGQSGDELAAGGSTVRFWVNAKGSPPFEYRWYHADEPIPDATLNYLVLPDIGLGDEGSYHAVISNSLGEAITESMKLKIGYSLAVDWYPVLGTVTGVPSDAVLLPGTEVVLEAEGTEAHEFLGWEGDLEATQNPLTIQVESNLHIRARFGVEPGTLLWTCDAGARVQGSPAIDGDGSVYFGTASEVFAVAGDTGEMRWSLAGPWRSGPACPAVGDHGLIYVSDKSSAVALEERDGCFAWRLDVLGRDLGIRNPTSVDRDGTVYVADGVGSLFARNGLTGDPVWTATTDGAPTPAAIDANGQRYVGTFGGKKIQALDSRDGTELWNTLTEASSYHSPTPNGSGNLFAGALGGIGPRHLTMLDTTTGERQWTTLLGASSSTFSSPTIGMNDTVLVPTIAGLFCVAQADGEILWSIPELTIGDSSPAVASDGSVFTGAKDGKLYAVNGQTGEVIWTYQTDGEIHSSPNIGVDGTVYIGSDDGKLYAIAGSAPLADTPWPKYQADMQNTGRVNVPPPVSVQLSGATLREDGAFVFEVQGPPSAEGVLERSENLREWSDADALVLDASGHAIVVADSAPTRIGRFYRVRLGP